MEGGLSEAQSSPRTAHSSPGPWCSGEDLGLHRLWGALGRWPARNHTAPWLHLQTGTGVAVSQELMRSQ